MQRQTKIRMHDSKWSTGLSDLAPGLCSGLSSSTWVLRRNIPGPTDSPPPRLTSQKRALRTPCATRHLARTTTTHSSHRPVRPLVRAAVPASAPAGCCDGRPPPSQRAPLPRSRAIQAAPLRWTRGPGRDWRSSAPQRSAPFFEFVWQWLRSVSWPSGCASDLHTSGKNRQRGTRVETVSK